MAPQTFRVFIGNLPSDCRREDILHFFRKFGRVHNVLIKNRRYGFAEFHDYRDADEAVYALNGRELGGNRVNVQHSKGVRPGGPGVRAAWTGKYGPPVRTKFRLRVENLSSGVGWQDLKDLLRWGGEVTYAEAHVSIVHEGLVEFETLEDLTRVLNKYQGEMVNGRRINLVMDYTPSRSRSRPRTRSISRSRLSRSISNRPRSASRPSGASRSRSRPPGASRSRSRSSRTSRSRSRPSGASRSRSRPLRTSKSSSRRRMSNSKSTSRPQNSKSSSRLRLSISRSRSKSRERISLQGPRSRSGVSKSSSRLSKSRKSRSRTEEYSSLLREFSP